VNLFLVPYTPMRHAAVALVTGAAGLLAWWAVLATMVLGAPWSAAWDGAVYLSGLAAAVAGASVLAEGTLSREGLARRVGRVALAGALALGFSLGAYWTWTAGVLPLAFGTGEMPADPTVYSIRYRLPAWIGAGFSAGLAAAIARRFQAFAGHLAGGVAAGLAGGLAWHLLGYPPYSLREVYSGLYLAGAGGALAFGAAYGLLAWGIPDRYYAGWIRVLTEERYARRVPIDGHDERPRERFVGHFPRGLDVFLPAEAQVAEMHISVYVDRNQLYRVRGLTLQPTRVRRFLERIDLAYDARRPAPLETRLQSGDRVELGPAGGGAVVEFVMLPREEK
jgi:hypothetical protein